jgi:hypothetical protein
MPRRWISKNTGLDFFNGLALAPLMLLFVGAFSETVLQALMRASPIILGGRQHFGAVRHSGS